MDEKHREKNFELEYFAQTCTHDLKEPLRAISSFVQLLLVHNAKTFDDKSMEYITYILKSINRMDILIRGILAYSQLSHVSGEYCEVDLACTIDEVKSDFVFLLNDIEASIHIDPLPTIWADAVQMYQLFSNLIGNAIKFRGTNPLIIHVYAIEHSEMWLISVKDNGIGIEEEYHLQVFDMFKRLNSIQIYEGSGVGLSICKKIVQTHNGEISVRSNLAEGSEFIIKLPKNRSKVMSKI